MDAYQHVRTWELRAFRQQVHADRLVLPCLGRDGVTTALRDMYRKYLRCAT